MYTVKLSHIPNPDIRDGGYWSAMRREGDMTVKVKTIYEAAQTCGQYIGLNDLGGGNWSGGQVFDAAGKQVARVSFNGRIWDNDGKELVPCEECHGAGIVERHHEVFGDDTPFLCGFCDESGVM